ncbi:MarR family winged helix-turn-helix transcriptional regulator [Paenibacillus sp. MMS18-CY102]|uniref:MarR family winged helix-turn-helix transcriptional regulator n=1 Tax=Paenibacillus sp. MMS18-CY102 TaxID=2682849 RepID=UPI0013665727|nr:MarR family transcriptional regulator [Paenibacillus sp. MMS18-CY102]MWC27970.1 MarR family transcriptional regulator [Paenibacillus sp. MMS18-CY102]
MGEFQRVHDVFASFREVNKAFYHTLSSAAHEYGVTPVQYLVLKTLDQCPDIGLSELAELIYSTNSTSSGVIERMVKAGWVSRERSETDRRSVKLSLTEEGKELWSKMYETRLKRLLPLQQTSEEDHATLLRIHKEIVSILNKAKEGQSHE